MMTHGQYCGRCGQWFDNLSTVGHQCAISKTAQGYASVAHDPIDYERVRLLIRQEIERAFDRRAIAAREETHDDVG